MSFIQEFLGTTAPKLDELNKFLAQKIREGTSLDYKASALLWDHEKRSVNEVGVAGFVEHVTGMTNSSGGLLVIGVNEEKSKNGEAKDRLGVPSSANHVLDGSLVEAQLVQKAYLKQQTQLFALEPQVGRVD